MYVPPLAHGLPSFCTRVAAMISSKLALHRMATGRRSRVVTAKTLLSQMLWRYQGHVSAALVLGGVDSTGFHLHSIYPHGSTDSLPYVTMGSGSLAAMAVFEAGFKEDMSREDGIALVHAAITSGIRNDLGSGSNVDICVLSLGDDGQVQKEYHHNYDQQMPRGFRKPGGYSFPKGTTATLSSVTVPLSSVVEVADGAAPMKLDDV